MFYNDHIPLAWKMLSLKKRRLAVSVGAITFTVMIMFMEFGFFNGLIDSQASFLTRFDADLVMISKEKKPIDKLLTFPLTDLKRGLAFDEVAEVIPIYESQTKFKHPQTKRTKTIYTVAFPVGSHPFYIEGLDKYMEILKRADSVLFDARSRNIFGKIYEGMEIEINDRKFKIRGMVEMGPSFIRDGYLFMSDNAWKKLKGPDTNLKVSYGLIRLKQNTEPETVQRKMEVLFSDILIKTPEQIVQQETRIILHSTPTGALFGIGVALGFIMGAIVCYQLLYNEIVDHVDQYATLKAIGFSKAYLCGIVIRKANLLSISGFIFGLLISSILYKLLQDRTHIIMSLNWGRILFVFGLTVLMCNLSGLLSIKKVLDIDPAEIF